MKYMSLIFVETNTFVECDAENPRAQVDSRLSLANNGYEVPPIDYCEQDYCFCFRKLYHRHIKTYVSTYLAPCTYRRIGVFY